MFGSIFDLVLTKFFAMSVPPFLILNGIRSLFLLLIWVLVRHCVSVKIALDLTLSMSSEHNQPSDYDRLVALRALREYMYLNKPVQFGAADFIEDIPSMRPYGMLAQDLIPSQAVISHNPQERHKEIARAMESVKHLHGHNSDLGAQTLRSGAAGALSSVPLSLLFGGVTRALTHGKGPGFALRDPGARTQLLRGLGEDVTNGAALGGAAGAVTPFLTQQMHPKAPALRQAADILQKHPYASGLPGGDVVAAMDYGHHESRGKRIAKGTAVGAGLGAAAGASAGALHSGSDYVSGLLRKKFIDPTGPAPKFRAGNFKRPGLIGAGTGAALGLLSSALLSDKRKT